MNHNIKKRLLSALVIIVLLSISILFRPLFTVLIFITAALILSEWYDMTRSSRVFCNSGLIIITVPLIALLMISSLDQTGEILLLLIVSISTIDSAAMFGGKFIRGAKLAPKISPNKTISGLISAIFAASLVPAIWNIVPGFDFVSHLQHKYGFVKVAIMWMSLALISQSSDLFISLFKRYFKVKDTGNIIPGHGGILDRFDSYILTAPIVLVFLLSAKI